MARRHRSARTTTVWYYDPLGRLRARVAPDGVTRFQWDGAHLVSVCGPPSPQVTPSHSPAEESPYEF